MSDPKNIGTSTVTAPRLIPERHDESLNVKETYEEVAAAKDVEETLRARGTKRSRSPSEEGEERDDGPPPLPDEEPPLPDEPVPEAVEPKGVDYTPQLNYDDEGPHDDGWSAVPHGDTFYFVNAFTGVRQWRNPRVPQPLSPTIRAPEHGGPPLPSSTYSRVVDNGPPGLAGASISDPSAPSAPAAGGYNPKIHGSWDPNADYAKVYEQDLPQDQTLVDALGYPNEVTYEQSGTFNRFTGSFQAAEKADYHNDENKSIRQLSAFYNTDDAANMNDGRSLKAERANKKLSKQQIKEFNDKKREKRQKKTRDFLTS